MSRWWSGWRVALRLAAREALRAKGRSLLVLVMITLPVLAVTTASVLYATSDISGKESLDRRLGTVASASVSPVAARRVVQGPDPDDGVGTSNGAGARRAHRPTLADVQEVLGGRPTMTVEHLATQVKTRVGEASAETYELDPTDPLAAGLFRLTDGHWPTTPDEVVVNQGLLDRGPKVGETLTITDGGTKSVTRRIVGIAESTTLRTPPVVVALPRSLDEALKASRPDVSWLVGGPAVSWAQVKALNDRGASVLSRDVVLHPPSDAQSPYSYGDDTEQYTVIALVVAMVLIEVILLAGPAFAVGARRQSRALALLAACGGSPRQARRVVLASGVVLGLASAAVGVGGGILLARIGTPIVQRFGDSWLGPFDVPWRAVGIVAAFGVASALLAAVVPARIASKQDVVAVLGGRRGDRKPSKASPVIGVIVVACGVLLAWEGTGRGGRVVTGNANLMIAASAIVCVLGMLFLVPVVVVGVAKLGSRLPLPLRFAVRDASRHRTRTVPAVAAVAATVAGVVALGIATSSDEAENVATYRPSLTMGAATILPFGDQPDTASWNDLRQQIAPYVSGERITPLEGIDTQYAPSGWRDVGWRFKGWNTWVTSYNGSLGASMLVSDGALPPFVTGLSKADRAGAERTLAHGGVVVFGTPESGTTVPSRQVRLYQRPENYSNGHRGKAVWTTADGWLADTHDQELPVAALVSPEVARRLGVTPSVTGLYLDGGTIDEDAEENVREVLNASGIRGTVYVERGYVAPGSVRAVRWLLAGLGLVLMLGGTLTATYLSLADARPDLATLAAVGARRRVRRLVSGSYALSIAFVGAVIGALVGCVPGIAITYPLTSSNGAYAFPEGMPVSSDLLQPTHFLDIPWLLVLGVVLAMPVGVALLVVVTTRARLPLTRRLD